MGEISNAGINAYCSFYIEENVMSRLAQEPNILRAESRETTYCYFDERERGERDVPPRELILYPECESDFSKLVEISDEKTIYRHLSNSAAYLHPYKMFMRQEFSHCEAILSTCRSYID